MKLTGKTALITGGSSGIGLATAKLFKKEGARIIITGRDIVSLEHARQAIGEDTLALRSDAGNLADIEQAAGQIKSQIGHLDIVVANAAIAQPAPFSQTTEAQFDDTVSVNFKGVFFTIQKTLPLMRTGGTIIVLTSISNQTGAPNFGVYAACKAGLHSLVKTLSQELIAQGIRVNAVSPGPTDTPGFGRWGVPQEIVEAARSQFTQKSPLKRFASPNEIARAVLFLASDDASYIVGHELVVDGGISQVM